jgi:hypothetical protein
MKKIFFFSLLLASTTVQAQAVLRVNNTPAANAPYTSLAAAITAAGVNDIILLEGSPTSYSNQFITKKVTIIGPGYFLNENTGLQANINPAIVGSIQLSSGSSGSTIKGLLFTGNLTIGNASNINFINNALTDSNSGNVTLLGPSSNNDIQGNYFHKIEGTTSNIITNTIVRNNLIISSVAYNATISLTLVNNTFLITNNTTHSMRNSVIQNNIFMGTGSFSASGSSIFNNVFVSSSQLGADGTNIFNVNSSTLFVGPAGNTSDSQWRLQAGSPAIGAGLGGTDCGMYGGSSPYRLSGIATGQHTIYNLQVPATVIQNGTLNVKVSAKVN